MYEQDRSEIAFIAVDWGSSNFRAYAVDKQGEIRQRTKAHQGVSRIKDQNFAGTLRRLLGKWFNKYPDVPVLMCGVIGGRQGWQEVEHAPAPIDIETLAKHAELIPNHFFERDIYIVPGVKIRRSDFDFDVIRGEEVQIFGALAQLPEADRHIICLPGTHTKWVEIRKGNIVDVQTFVTGEMFSLLSRFSTISTIVEGSSYSSEGFAKGLIAAKNGALLNELFKLRVAVASKQLVSHEASSYLSGLLVANEIEGAVKMIGKTDNVTVVAVPWLMDMYQQSLASYGISITEVKSDEATARGLLKVFNALPKKIPRDADNKGNRKPVDHSEWY